MRVGASANCYNEPADANSGAKYVAMRVRTEIESFQHPETAKCVDCGHMGQRNEHGICIAPSTFHGEMNVCWCKCVFSAGAEEYADGPSGLEQGKSVDEVMANFAEYDLPETTDEGPTGCLDDNDELSQALRQITPERLNEILRNELHGGADEAERQDPQTLYAMFEEWRLRFPERHRPERGAPETELLSDAWIAGFAKHHKITCAAVRAGSVEPLFTEGNRAEAIRLLRELREKGQSKL
jgi:hypothetical protein